jgi:RNA polymerase sigma factor (sigma-70 family)
MMTQQPMAAALNHLDNLIGPCQRGEPSDRQLLECFAANMDDAAFATLVRRHGAMVLDTCRRILSHHQDAEDAFQATFLVLAQKAGSLRWQETVGPWLHQVAYRIALRARTSTIRRRVHEKEAGRMAKPEPLPMASCRAFGSILDDELQQLPEKYRAPLILCYLEGQAQAEAAKRLGCSEATLNRRLSEGRERLRVQLQRRGITLSAVLVAVGLAQRPARATLPSLLVSTTVKRILCTVAEKTAGGVTTKVATLATGVMETVASAGTKLGITLFVALSLITGTGLLAYQNLSNKPREQGNPADSQSRAVGDRRSTIEDLPAGAVARLGSVGLQQDEAIFTIAFSPDGKTLVTGGRFYAGDPGRGLGALAVRRSGPGAAPDVSRVTAITLWDPVSGKKIRDMEGTVKEASKLAFSPDGKTLLMLGIATKEGEAFAIIRRSDVATGKEIVQLKCDNLPMGESVQAAEFSPSGKVLATALTIQEPDRTTKGILQLWDAATGERLAEWASGDSVHSIAFSPDGELLATGSDARDNGVRLWAVRTRTEVRQLQGSEGYRRPVFSPDGKTVSATNPTNSVMLWETETGKVRHTLEGHGATVWKMAFSPNGTTFATLAGDNVVRIWNLDTGTIRHEWPLAVTALSPLAFSPDGKVLAVGTSSNSVRGVVRMLDPITGREVGPKAHSHAALHRVACSADGKIVATAGTDVVRVWNSSTGKEIRSFNDTGHGVSGVNLSADGARLATVGRDATVRLRDVATGRDLSQFDLAAAGPVTKTFFSPDGKTLLAVGERSDVSLWNVESGERFRTLTGDNPHVLAVALSVDGKQLAMSEGNGNVRVWDVSSGQPRTWRKKRAVLKADPAGALAFSPDGHYLASGHAQATRIWELATGEIVDEFKRAGAFAFSSDGRALAVQSGRQIHLIDLASSNELPPLTGHQWAINALTFSQDGTRLVSVSDDTTGLVWDAASLLPLTRLVERSKAGVRTIWDDLGDDDETVAYRAGWQLTNSTPSVVARLRDRLKPVSAAPETKRIEALIGKLGADEDGARNRAYEDLEELGAVVEPALVRALKSGPPLESRRRLEVLLARVSKLTQERLRQLRALLALERAGSPEARQLIKSLAEGEDGAWLTEQAREALERLERRVASKPAAAPGTE